MPDSGFKVNGLVKRQQIWTDLILDKQIHELLCQMDFLCQRTTREVQDPLELRFYLHDTHGKQAARQLHTPDGVGKALLLRGQTTYFL